MGGKGTLKLKDKGENKWKVERGEHIKNLSGEGGGRGVHVWERM